MKHSNRIEILAKIATVAHDGTEAARYIAQMAEPAFGAIARQLVKAFEDLLAIAQTQNIDIADNYQALANLQKHVERLEEQAKNPWLSDSSEEIVLKWVKAYKEEFEGYDEFTFIDFLVTQLHLRRANPFKGKDILHSQDRPKSIIEWYRKRADELEPTPKK